MNATTPQEAIRKALEDSNELLRTIGGEGVEQALAQIHDNLNALDALASCQQADSAGDPVPKFFPGDRVRAWNEHHHHWTGIIHRAETRWDRSRRSFVVYTVKADIDGSKSVVRKVEAAAPQPPRENASEPDEMSDDENLSDRLAGM